MEKNYCFEVISPDTRLTLRATNETEFKYATPIPFHLIGRLTDYLFSDWIELLREAIATQLAGNRRNLNKGKYNTT